MSASITMIPTETFDNCGGSKVEPKKIGINTLPNEILGLIFSNLDTTSDISAAMLTCKRWTPIAEEYLLTSDKAIKMGLADSEFDPSLNLSAVEIAELVLVACKNMKRIRRHVANLKNALREGHKRLPTGCRSTTPELWLRSKRFDTIDSQYKLISHFLATVGLPTDEKGLVSNELEVVKIRKKTPYYELPEDRRIKLVPELDANPRDAMILLNLTFENRVRAINLFLTNFYLKCALYSLGKPGQNTSNLITKMEWSSFAKYTRASIRALQNCSDLKMER